MAPVEIDAASSPAEHTKYARDLLRRALARSEALCGDYQELDDLLLEAKVRGFSGIEGLEYAIAKMGG